MIIRGRLKCFPRFVFLCFPTISPLQRNKGQVPPFTWLATYCICAWFRNSTTALSQTCLNRPAHLQWLLTPFQESPDLYSLPLQILQIYYLLNIAIGLYIRGGIKYLSDFPAEAVSEAEKIIVP